MFPIVSADENTLNAALAAALDHSISFWDAMLWATARQAGCDCILSEDFQDGRSLGGVTFLNPFEPRNAPRLDRVLPKL